MAKLTDQQRAAFAAKCKPVGNGCVEWQGCRNADGYGEFMARPQKWRAHRLAWTMTHGDIPAVPVAVTLSAAPGNTAVGQAG
jgi:hypothetical protein